MPKALTLLAALFLAQAAAAHEVKVGDLQVIHPNIPLPAATAPVAAGYMAIANDGAVADRLLTIEAGFAKSASLHLSKVDESGVATMEPVEALDIPAGDTVLLEPGGYHIMFMGLTGPLAEGAMLPVTLTFEHAGKATVEFMVDPPGGSDHDHDMGDMGSDTDE